MFRERRRILAVGITLTSFFLVVYLIGRPVHPSLAGAETNASVEHKTALAGSETKVAGPKTKAAGPKTKEIPKLLHLVYKDENVPTMYRAPVQSWLRYNPSWQVWFWTDADAENLLTDKYPQFLQLYKNYTHALQRSDAIRYFILHQYGGIYSDMDVRSLKPVDPLLNDRTCVLSPEPPLQTKMIFNRANTLTNSLMACVGDHPFLRHVINGLEAASNRSHEPEGILLSTGPFFLNDTYNSYVHAYPACATDRSESATVALPRGGNASDRFYASERNQSPFRNCHVTVVDNKYMCPTLDMPMIKLRKKFCADGAQKKGFYQQVACDQLQKNGFAKQTFPPEAFADHLWYHFGWSSDKEKQARQTINIGKVLHKLTRYKKNLS